MQFALGSDGSRIEASINRTAVCPICATPVIAKMGEIVIHHWAHKSLVECDPWWEPEGEWHRSWKALVPPSRCEVTRGCHRADIVRSDGVVIELQHSPISVPEIRERERAYAPMIWLFDGRDIGWEVREGWETMMTNTDDPQLIFRTKPEFYTFRWKHPRKHYAYCEQPVYIDLGQSLIFNMRKLNISGGPPYGGWGKMHSRDAGFDTWLTQ